LNGGHPNHSLKIGAVESKGVSEEIADFGFQLKSSLYSLVKRLMILGYDSAMEAAFFIAADALLRPQPGAGNRAAILLRAFDANRELICATCRETLRPWQTRLL
jgi:hypothetical protein